MGKRHQRGGGSGGEEEDEDVEDWKDTKELGGDEQYGKEKDVKGKRYLNRINGGI